MNINEDRRSMPRIAAALKLFGLVSVRAGVIEMAAVAIALAHVR